MGPDVPSAVGTKLFPEPCPLGLVFFDFKNPAVVIEDAAGYGRAVQVGQRTRGPQSAEGLSREGIAGIEAGLGLCGCRRRKLAENRVRVVRFVSFLCKEGQSTVFEICSRSCRRNTPAPAAMTAPMYVFCDLAEPRVHCHEARRQGVGGWRVNNNVGLHTHWNNPP